MARKSSFAEKVASDSKRKREQSRQFTYLSVPKELPMFKEKGDTVVLVDVIPYVVTDQKHPDRRDEDGIAQVGDLWYKRPIIVHHGIGSDSETIICPRSVGKKCPVDEYRKRMFKEGTVKKEDLKAIRPSTRILYLIVPIDVEGYKRELHIWNISYATFQKFLDEELKYNKGYGIFPDPKSGLTLQLRFSTESLGSNTFAKVSRIDFYERDKQYTDEFLAKVPSLDGMFPVLSYAEIEEKFLEVEKDDIPEQEAKEHEAEVAAQEETVAQEPGAAPASRKPFQPHTEVPAKEGGEPKMTRQAPPRKETAAPAPEAGPAEPAPAPTPRRPAPAPARAPAEAEAEKKGCPHGHKFGVDIDQSADCENCENWSECVDEKEAIESGAAKS